MTSKPRVDHSNGTLQPSLSASSGHLLPSPIPPPTSSSSSLRPPSAQNNRPSDDQLDGAAVRKSHSQSVSSNPNTLASSKGTNASKGSNKDRSRAVRTLPPWVQSVEDDEDERADASSFLLPRTPTSAKYAHHHFLPTPKGSVAGRKFDHAREGTPVTITKPIEEQASSWGPLVKANYEHRPLSSRGQIVDDEWMRNNLPDLEAPWDPIDKEEDENLGGGFWLFSPQKRSRKIKRLHRVIMMHPMVPLAVRLTVLTFSCLALGLAGSIFHRSDSAGCKNNSSTWLAVIVDVVAIVYISYITYDEYTSKPLGLRSHTAKMTLIFADLVFIVFDSANLSLAFQALTDELWACRDNATSELNTCAFSKDICVRQKALTATLLIALVAWLVTFAISTLRYENSLSSYPLALSHQNIQ
ncbi:hypothetical protein BDV96DRAFT_501946 [Lophiotrema nucula]|uniref:Regulator of phospholipase D SRF1 n=1 Tax=Lophiotrema nucula TaxID=690887 RepID=A0A6A5YSW8_9PLEO|nr:hypothetical protein BDV96DRAFT_501946 [Lophiotrema nucula]